MNPKKSKPTARADDMSKIGRPITAAEVESLRPPIVEAHYDGVNTAIRSAWDHSLGRASVSEGALASYVREAVKAAGGKADVDRIGWLLANEWRRPLAEAYGRVGWVVTRVAADAAGEPVWTFTPTRGQRD